MSEIHEVVFFGIDEACDLAVKTWGPLARCWNREVKEIGTGGAGCSHVVLGSGASWLEACRDAGLL